MLCLREGARGTEVLLGRRARRAGDPWSGHIGLPGGRIDPPDPSPLAAAIRETVEEVGFDPTVEGRLLGALDPLHGRMNSVLVAPFVAEIRTAVEPRVSPELASAWWAPFAAMEARDVTVSEVPYPMPALVTVDADGVEAVVWGMTFRVLQSAGELAG
jgi:8-oxo-dGTP pyrophosphatase MutT (NUDIX family)